MQIKEIIQYLETFAPPSLQESYDNAGLIVGNPTMECMGALLCLDSTEEVIDEAVRKGYNLVIAHHPIVFSGLKRLNGSNYIERTIIKAIKHDVAIYAAHTNLDNVQAGVNAKICEKLGLVKTSILVPKKGLLKKLVTFAPTKDAEAVRAALFAAGAGHIGNYSEASYNLEGNGTFKAGAGADPHVGDIGKRHTEPETRIETIFPAHIQRQVLQSLLAVHPYEEVAYDIYALDNVAQHIGSGMIGELPTSMAETDFLTHIKATMEAKVIRHTKLLGRQVKKVAVCGGSGSFLLNDAIRHKADVFITADFKYHQFFDADSQIVIADIGHYETEHFTPEIFHALLTEKFRTFAFAFSETGTNPVNYF